MAEPERPELGTYSARFRGLALVCLCAVMAVIWGLAGGYGWPVFYLGASGVLGLALVWLSATDLKAHFLPDVITLPLILAGLGVNIGAVDTLLWSGVGACVGYGLVAGLRWLWLKRKGVEAIGLGDAKLLAAGGAWVGAAGLPFILLVSSGSALILLLLSGGLKRERAVPFGVFLGLGIWAAWCVLGPMALTRIS